MNPWIFFYITRICTRIIVKRLFSNKI